ncbi:MAG: GNAT family N-acetyltransferase [Parvularculaceae bacterium]
MSPLTPTPFTIGDVSVRADLRPGDLGRLIALHGRAYEGETTHFGVVFEAYVAETVAEYVIGNAARGRIWFAERGRELVATTAMAERRDGARRRGQLRWIVADRSVRGMGIGRRLIDEAMAYARVEGFDEVFLETTEGLDASMAIYERLGFQVVSRERQKLWLDENVVITMALSLSDR